MKILTIGIGECGGRIADEFERLNKRARSMRGVEIVTGTFALDTDTAALSELSSLKADYKRRILVGVRENRGQGKVSINEIGAAIAKKEGDKLLNEVRLVKRFQETDAILVAASGAGGTGSGAMPVIIRNLKEKYQDKAVYGLVVFPFEHEIQAEARLVLNTASCLKSSYTVADAIFIIDNQEYVQRDSSLIHDLGRLNQFIIEPFYNLLRAGEEKKTRYIGSKLMDAGDIMETIKGWTVLGHGQSPLSLTSQMIKSLNFKKKGAETDVGIKVMEEAFSNLSVKCNPSDAATALFLLSAPAREITMNLLEYLGNYMKNVATNAIIRSGDYPVEKGLISIDVILSQLGDVEKVREIYGAAVNVPGEVTSGESNSDDEI
ncbi:MAG: cell division protein FtsZ [Dehalococcoidales bacterium]|nr:cell division protein FtsZ [Dehalococcoidales bacterium]